MVDNRVTSLPVSTSTALPTLPNGSEKNDGKCVFVYLFTQQLFIASHSTGQVGLQL